MILDDKTLDMHDYLITSNSGAFRFRRRLILPYFIFKIYPPTPLAKNPAVRV
mgnify:CR=1 FL=1